MRSARETWTVVAMATAWLLVAGSQQGISSQRSAPPPIGPITGTRIVEVELEPAEPTFGEVFQIHVTARLPRRSGVSVVDTLGPTNALRSAGPGRWEEGGAPGDSIELRATFPVLSFRDGPRELPGLLIRTGGARSAPGMPDVPERLSLGSVQIRPLAGFGPEGGATAPRTPADVVGGSWSVWVVLAGGILVLGALGAGRVVLRSERATGTGPTAEVLDDSDRVLDRENALQRMDEIRATGWHRNGRVDDFYRASTDTLRGFAEGKNASWGADLTSTELLRRIEERWGGSRIEGLRSSVDLAERVKFGRARPPADTAEGDWETIRKWIETAP